MPRGGGLHEVRRWACCAVGLRRTGGPSPELPTFWGGFVRMWHCHSGSVRCVCSLPCRVCVDLQDVVDVALQGQHEDAPAL